MKSEHDDAQEKVTAWLNQDQPFHGLSHVAIVDRLAMHGSEKKSTPCSSMNVEKGSDQESSSLALENEK